MDGDNIVWKATNHYGETCHFGTKPCAKAWAKGGSVEAVPVVVRRGARLQAVKAESPVRAEAWLYEVRFNGSGQNPATDWQKYGVYETRQQAERGLKHCGGELEGRVVPLVRAAAQGVKP